MTSHAYFYYAPEIGLIVAACVVLLLGISRSPAVRALAAPVALVSLLAAIGVGYFYAEPAVGTALAGFRITALSIFVRHITLAVGALLVMVAWNQPAAGERGENTNKPRNAKNRSYPRSGRPSCRM